MNKKDVVVFGDQIGRLIIGEIVDNDEETTLVKNPLIVSIHKSQDNQGRETSGINFLPFVYLEIVDNFGFDFEWEFSNASHTFNNGTVSDQALSLYRNTVDSIRNKLEDSQETIDSGTIDSGQAVELFDGGDK